MWEQPRVQALASASGAFLVPLAKNWSRREEPRWVLTNAPWKMQLMAEYIPSSVDPLLRIPS